MGDFSNSEECGDFGSSGDSCELSDSLKSSDSGEWGELGGNSDFGNSCEYFCSGESC